MKKNNAFRIFAATAGTLIALLLGLISLVLIGFDTGMVGFFLGLVMATVPVPFYVMFIRWIDHFEPEPWWLLGVAFIWGAAVASFVSLIFNSINAMILTETAGEAADALGAVISAPFVEELAKGIALFLLFFWKRDEFDNVTDGIVYASMVGLGFAMTENVAYYGRAVAEGGVPTAGILFFVRGIMSPFAHPLFTSMTGIGLGAARESEKGWVKWIAPTAGLCAAMILHALWNLSAVLGPLFFVMYAIVMVPSAIAVTVVAYFSVRRESRVVRLHLEGIVGDGVLSSDDVICLCSPWARFSASTNALADGGPAAWVARGRFHRAATDFAFHSWRTSRGLSEDAEGLRSALVEEVRRARGAAGLPPIVDYPDKGLVRRLTAAHRLPQVEVATHESSLLCTSGALAGRTFEIGHNGLTIGRDPASSAIVIPEERVSKRHAWVGHRDGALVVVDRGSTNGTQLNGERIFTASLKNGDRLTLANLVTFEVRSTGD